MKERSSLQPEENPVLEEPGDIDPRDMDADEINLEEIAKRPDWREILREVVRKGDMDPWDIKVSKLVGEYLQTIKKMKKLNLRVPANVLLASSILLREKSGSWILEKKEESEKIDIWENLPPTPDQIPPPREEIPEPKPKKRETRKKVSLDELITAVDQVINKEKEKAKKKAKEEKGEVGTQDIVPNELIELAREGENFEEEIRETEKRIKSSIDEEDLTCFTEVLEDSEESRKVVSTLISLLHLANKGTVSIWQEKIFGDIFIHYRGEENEEKKDKEND